ncbi:unnamed protein product [Prorocentrum cordatum]|uniref:Uncharacterized protein n=1 Tax=Prorocentrum cordatum TaxID=2364126 RepID=A0ABN9P745_9DINO|nr:unnamed protein product [Polarella glacialis]
MGATSLPVGVSVLDTRSPEYRALEAQGRGAPAGPPPPLLFARAPAGPRTPLAGELQGSEPELSEEHPYQEAFEFAAALVLLLQGVEDTASVLDIAEEVWLQQHREAIAVQDARPEARAECRRQMRELEIGCSLVARLRTRTASSAAWIPRLPGGEAVGAEDASGAWRG